MWYGYFCLSVFIGGDHNMIFIFNNAFLDAATPWQVGFQDPATPIIIGIIHFHNHLIFFLVVIGTFVCWLLYKALVLFKEDPSREASQFTHSTPLEVVWTITPALLLLLIAGPSFALLYSIDEVIAPHISLKVIGHQWYWSYEYSDYEEPTSGESIKFDSYMVAEDDLSLGGLRLLEVDHRVKLPTNVHIRVLVSAADVLHSWAVPSLGIKIDACPGRLNQVSLFLIRKGVFYGQCSEICGVNHAFIPIVVESISEDSYLNWVNSSLPDPIEVDPLSLDWLKGTLMYHRELKHGHDIIAHAQEGFSEYCPGNYENSLECKKEFMASFKESMLLQDRIEKLEAFKQLLDRLLPPKK